MLRKQTIEEYCVHYQLQAKHFLRKQTRQMDNMLKFQYTQVFFFFLFLSIYLYSFKNNKKLNLLDLFKNNSSIFLGFKTDMFSLFIKIDKL